MGGRKLKLRGSLVVALKCVPLSEGLILSLPGP